MTAARIIMLAILVGAAACNEAAPSSEATGTDTGNGTEASSDSSTTGSGSLDSTGPESVDDTGMASTGSTNETVEVPVQADTTIDNLNPDTNYGAAPVLEVESDDGREQRSYLRFVVPELPGAIVSARIVLRVAEASDYGGDIFAVPDVDDQGMQWTEDTLTWNNATPVEGLPLASITTVPVVGQFVSFDVTDGILGPGSHSFAITTPSADEVEYASKETDAPPVLVIEVAS